LPSLTGEFDLIIKKANSEGGFYQTAKFSDTVVEKANIIIDAIQENWGEVFVYSDVDIQFFKKPVKSILLEQINGYDIACQCDIPGSTGQLCTGFFICRANEKTLKLWKIVRKKIHREKRDQYAFNRTLKRVDLWFWNFIYMTPKIRYKTLPYVFYSPGIYNGKAWIQSGKSWKPGDIFKIPEGILIHHANWAIGTENKVAQLEYVRGIVLKGDK